MTKTKSKRIIVTGAAGFIGSNLCELLLAQGHQVIGVDNLNDFLYSAYRKHENLYNCYHNPNFYFFPISFYHPDMNNILRQGIDVVVHLAAHAGVRPSIQNPHAYYRNNVEGTLLLLNMMVRHGVGHMVFASSSSVYGERTNVPFKEEDKVDTPISPYAATKKACEEMGFTFFTNHKINFTALRFFTVYGPRGRPDMAPYKFMDAVLRNKPILVYGDGTAKRDFTFVGDIIDGIHSAILNPMGYEIFNLGNGTPLSVMDLINETESVTGINAIIEYKTPAIGDVPITYADISKAKKLLKYNPQTPLRAGLTRMYDWWR